MKKIFLISIIALFMLRGDNFAQSYNPFFGDKRLELIHDEFINDCNRFGFGGFVMGKTLRVMDYEDLGYGYFGITFPKSGIILIDTSNMESSYELLYIVTYHELAHFYLEAPHINCNFCIMKPEVNKRNAEIMYNRIEYYKNLLFKMANFRLFFRNKQVNDLFKDYFINFTPLGHEKSINLD